MQLGRMKGQAFVGMPSETVAIRAVKETNGYLLHGKPMVVVSTISCDLISLNSYALTKSVWSSMYLYV